VIGESDTLRIALADDSALFRDGLTSLLESQGMVVTVAASSGAELLAAVGADPPDVAILDVRMPPTFTDEGIRTAVALRERHPRTAVLVLTTYLEASLAAELLRSGTRGTGYLLKDRVDSVSTLVDVLARLRAGESVIDPEIIGRLLAHQRSRSILDRLSPREGAVLGLIAEGHSNAGIGRRLHLSTKTVESNIASIFLKLDMPPNPDENRRVLAVLTLLRHGGPQEG
jgi:DNA-binding NarL/FixJ family response regulator